MNRGLVGHQPKYLSYFVWKLQDKECKYEYQQYAHKRNMGGRQPDAISIANAPFLYRKKQQTRLFQVMINDNMFPLCEN